MGSPLDSTFCRCVSRISVGRKVAGNDIPGRNEVANGICILDWILGCLEEERNSNAPIPTDGSIAVNECDPTR